MKNAIEGKCACSEQRNTTPIPCVWTGEEWYIYLPWMATSFSVPEGYCWKCGCALGEGGIAYPTMVLPEEPIEVWLATDARGGAIGTPDEFAVGLFGGGEPTMITEGADTGWWDCNSGGGIDSCLASTSQPEQEGYPAPGQKAKYYLMPAEEADDDKRA